MNIIEQLSLDKVMLEKRVAELEAEVRDHAQWARTIIEDPNSAGAIALVNHITELENALRGLVASIRAFDAASRGAFVLAMFHGEALRIADAALKADSGSEHTGKAGERRDER